MSADAVLVCVRPKSLIVIINRLFVGLLDIRARGPSQVLLAEETRALQPTEVQELLALGMPDDFASYD